jgi:hypothetical protein
VVTSAALRAEVLERMAQLGRGRTLQVSRIARHGEPRSDGAVWNALEDLWVAEAVDWMGEDRYRLPHHAEQQLQMRGTGA